MTKNWQHKKIYISNRYFQLLLVAIDKGSYQPKLVSWKEWSAALNEAWGVALSPSMGNSIQQTFHCPLKARSYPGPEGKGWDKALTGHRVKLPRKGSISAIPCLWRTDCSLDPAPGVMPAIHSTSPSQWSLSSRDTWGNEDLAEPLHPCGTPGPLKTSIKTLGPHREVLDGWSVHNARA